MMLKDKALLRLQLSKVNYEIDVIKHDLDAIGLPWAAQEVRLAKQIDALVSIVGKLLEQFSPTPD